MYTRRILVTWSMIAFAVLALASTAVGQTGVVPTTVTATPDNFPGEIEPGNPRSEPSGFIKLCFATSQAGGFNPNQDTWQFTVNLDSAPDWLDISMPSDATVDFTPALGPTQAPVQCADTEIVNWEFKASASADAPNSTTGEAVFSITLPTTEAGTYQAPAAIGTVTLSVTTAAPTGNEIIPGVSVPPSTGSTPEPEDEPEESPAAGPVLLLVAVGTALALARRRS